MIEVDCEVLRTFRDSDGESFVRVQQTTWESWYYGRGAELNGCPLAPEVPWVERPPSPDDWGFLVYDFHLLNPDDLDRFVPGSHVMFRPGIPQWVRP